MEIREERKKNEGGKERKRRRERGEEEEDSRVGTEGKENGKCCNRSSYFLFNFFIIVIFRV